MIQTYLLDSFNDEFSEVCDYRDLIHASSNFAFDRHHCKRAVYMKRKSISDKTNDTDIWSIKTLSVMDVGYISLDGLVRADLVGDASLQSALSRILESPAVDRVLIDCVVSQYASQYLIYIPNPDIAK